MYPPVVEQIEDLVHWTLDEEVEQHPEPKNEVIARVSPSEESIQELALHSLPSAEINHLINTHATVRICVLQGEQVIVRVHRHPKDSVHQKPEFDEGNGVLWKFFVEVCGLRVERQ